MADDDARTFFIRCGECEEMYRPLEDMLSGEPIWAKPKKKRGGCQHDFSFAQVWHGRDDGWVAPITTGVMP